MVLRFVRRAVVALLLAAAPVASAQPCTPFTDVSVQDAFCGNVQWMYNRGITLGCTPTTYCPSQSVTRIQMAAFMNRLGNVTFQQGGNAFGTTAVIGTNDDKMLEIVANGSRAMRYEPNPFTLNIVGGHAVNDLSPGVRGATIAGGGASASVPDPDFNFITRGANRARSGYVTVSGGQNNRAGDQSGDLVSGAFATIGGGSTNTASRLYSTIGGGGINAANGSSSTIGGGFSNTANGNGSTVAGGSTNTATGHASTIAGGESNFAGGDYSFAAGRRAKATAPGSFMWADASNVDFGVNETNFFAVRATGGVGFTVAIDGNGGGTQFCDLRPGIAGWQCVSDRNAKENFESPDGEAILDRLVAMPLYTYNFKGADPAIRNLGPTAQDFRAAFHLGNDDRTIAQGNVQGVALAAIQGLNARLEAAVARLDRALADRDARIEAQREEIARLRASLASGANRDGSRVIPTLARSSHDW